MKEKNKHYHAEKHGNEYAKRKHDDEKFNGFEKEQGSTTNNYNYNFNLNNYNFKQTNYFNQTNQFFVFSNSPFQQQEEGPEGNSDWNECPEQDGDSFLVTKHSLGAKCISVLIGKYECVHIEKRLALLVQNRLIMKIPYRETYAIIKKRGNIKTVLDVLIPEIPSKFLMDKDTKEDVKFYLETLLGYDYKDKLQRATFNANFRHAIKLNR